MNDLVKSTIVSIAKAGVSLILANLANDTMKSCAKDAIAKTKQTINFARNSWAEKKLAKIA